MRVPVEEEIECEHYRVACEEHHVTQPNEVAIAMCCHGVRLHTWWASACCMERHGKLVSSMPLWHD